MQHDRNTWRIANLVLRKLAELQWQSIIDADRKTACVESSLDQIRSIRRKLSKATEHEFPGAARRLQIQLRHRLADLRYELEDAHRAAIQDSRRLPSPHDLCKDLAQLRDEFGQWNYRTTDQTLCVETEPITLDDVYLGSFSIQLQLGNLDRPAPHTPFVACALDPQSAAGNDTVTHPHVNDDQICTGEAAGPVRNCLNEGRLCDFFLLIRSVLQTYNSDSPYVKLEDWHGRSCDECAYNVRDEDAYYCESCDGSYCEDCISGCRNCDTTMCRGCVENCPACEDPMCNSCLEHCTNCDEACCVACLDDELCPDCIEQKEQSHEDQDEQTIETQSPEEQTIETERTVRAESAQSQETFTTSVA